MIITSHPINHVLGIASKEFVTTFEELLRETWIGFINRSTTSGTNPTAAAVAVLQILDPGQVPDSQSAEFLQGLCALGGADRLVDIGVWVFSPSLATKE